MNNVGNLIDEYTDAISMNIMQPLMTITHHLTDVMIHNAHVITQWWYRCDNCTL